MRKLILSAAVLLLLVAAVRLFTTMFSTTPARAEDVPFDDTLRRIRIPTVMYHYISVPPGNSDIYRIDLSVNPENFRQQMQWLKANDFHTISMDQFVGALKRGDELPSNPVLLTFDDGYIDAYTQAFPILKEYGFVGTFFVVTDWIDQHRRGYLTWDQVKEMADAGMSIHSHSRDHLDVRDRDDAWFAYQIAATYDTLDAHLGKQLRVFCYPSGRLDDETVERLARIGVVAAFTTQDGTINTSDTSMLRLPRVRMRNTTSVQDFAHLLRWVR
jgi:peptidoglycan/xylan/chitin deacetylase (PgdA/CDA1 family)